jgi:hypothetical protein
MDIHCRHCGEPWELDTLPRRGARGVKQNVLPVVREPWGVGRGEGVAIFG